VIGPAGGGALIDALSWRAIFWVNIPLIVVTLLVTRAAVMESKDPEADRTIDWLGIALSATGLGGPVYALIQQPTHGWGDPMVWVPLVGGVALFGAFLVWVSRYRHSMLDLSLFRIRNFAITNVETLIVYAALYGAFFFITLFLQETLDYSPLIAGLATTPVSVILFVLSPIFGRFSTATGPRLPMAVGPIVGGLGLLLLIRVSADADYVTDILPGILVFGLGLSATVAPLTATALNSVQENHVGVASGINNGVARIAGLLAIAILGAVISGSFDSTIDENLSRTQLSAQGQEAVSDAKQQPLGVPDTGDLASEEANRVRTAATDASETGFHLGLGLAGALMIVGGVIAGIGIENPKRKTEYEAPAAAPAGECAHCPDHLDDRPGREPVAEPT
jgi:MFS family permease